MTYFNTIIWQDNSTSIKQYYDVRESNQNLTV